MRHTICISYLEEYKGTKYLVIKPTFLARIFGDSFIVTQEEMKEHLKRMESEKK